MSICSETAKIDMVAELKLHWQPLGRPETVTVLWQTAAQFTAFQAAVAQQYKSQYLVE